MAPEMLSKSRLVFHPSNPIDVPKLLEMSAAERVDALLCQVPVMRAKLLSELGPEVEAEAMELMNADQRARVLAAMTDEVRMDHLDKMSDDDRDAIEAAGADIEDDVDEWNVRTTDDWLPSLSPAFPFLTPTPFDFSPHTSYDDSARITSLWVSALCLTL
jgi:hypothetical protein